MLFDVLYLHCRFSISPTPKTRLYGSGRVFFGSLAFETRKMPKDKKLNLIV